MKNITKLFCVGGMALIGLTGCLKETDYSSQRDLKPKTEEVKVKVPEVRNYFGELIQPFYNPIVTFGDFDNDGDLDLIVTQIDRGRALELEQGYTSLKITEKEISH